MKDFFLGLRKNNAETNPELVGRNCPWLDKQKDLKCTGDLKKYRTINGTCNNLKQPLYGLGGTPFQRILEDADYNKDSGK